MSDADLIKTICHGPDPARERAWLQLDHHFRPPLFRLLVTYLKSEADVEDCLQQVFLKVWRDACKFRGSSGIWTWLRLLARSAAVDHIRKRNRAPDINSKSGNPEEEATPEEDLPVFAPVPDNRDHETQRIADEAFIEFERRYPERALLLRMYTLEGASVAEIAESIGVSPDTTKVRLFRARVQYRNLFFERTRETG